MDADLALKSTQSRHASSKRPFNSNTTPHTHTDLDALLLSDKNKDAQNEYHARAHNHAGFSEERCYTRSKTYQQSDQESDNWSSWLVLYPCSILACIALILREIYRGDGKTCDLAVAWMEECANSCVQSPFEYPCDDEMNEGAADYDAETDEEEEEDACEHAQAPCGGKSVKVVRITKPEIPPEAFHAVGQAMARSISSVSSSQVCVPPYGPFALRRIAYRTMNHGVCAEAFAWSIAACVVS
jgi:hypothetical protein